MNKAIIINLVFLAYCIGLVIAISSVNTELESAIENRNPSGSSIEVKPARSYEDCLQCAAGGRNVQNTVDGSYYQQGEPATHIDEVIPRTVITGQF